MSTPDLHLRTLCVLSDEGRIVSTREPTPRRGALLALVRSATACAWAVREDLPSDLAGALERLARDEPPAPDLQAPPVHAARYRALLEAWRATAHAGQALLSPWSGPAFTFPATLPEPKGVVVVEDERLLDRHFNGWVAGEIAAGRAPLLAIMHDGIPISICFSARLSKEAAEAGLDTAEAFRGRGFAPRVTAAWALAIRTRGLVPLYSTSWTNTASLAVARKLGLLAYASGWSLSD